MTEKVMKIWPFHSAPAELQALSTNGGDEDFVALVPHGPFDLLEDDWFGQMKEDENGNYTEWDGRVGSMFGVFSIDRYELPNGDVVYIGSHA